MQPAVFLDRDNTLILNDGDLGKPEQVRLVDGVPAGLRALREAGFSLVVVTNQAGVARGKFTEEDVDAVHQRIASLVDGQAHRSGVIDRFYYCPYHPEGGVAEYRRDHPWRKPHPGMILQASRDMEIDLSRSWLIGDQERDIEAGRAAGCRTIVVTRDGELARRAGATAVAGDFPEAVRLIIGQGRAPEHGGVAAPEVFMPRGDVPSDSIRRTPADGVGRPSRESPDGADAGLRRVIGELVDEVRADRLRRADFTLLKMIAGVCQLLALLLALLGLMQLSNTDAFLKWMVSAGLAQLLTITLLVVDLKG